MTRTEIINLIIKNNNSKTYLEIGTGNSVNYNNIKCENKIGIDPNSKNNNILKMKSDDFFRQNKNRFDVIFIDGLHYSDQVYSDINNSLDSLNEGGYIICHDMNPTTEVMQLVTTNRPGGEWTGDCWKAWVKLRSDRGDLNMFVVNSDYGCGIISRGSQEKLILTEELNWNNFNKNKEEWLNLISVSDFLNQFKKIKFGVCGNDCATGGFFSNFFTTLSTTMEVEKIGLVPYVDMNISAFNKYEEESKEENVWNWWFNQITPKDTDKQTNVKMTLKNFDQGDGVSLWNRSDIHSSVSFFNKHFSIKNHILKNVSEYYDRYFKDKVVLGVMARGTELNYVHPQYGNQNAYTYIDGAKKFIEDHHVDIIFLVTEDNDWVKVFEENFTNLIYMNVFRRTFQAIEYGKVDGHWQDKLLTYKNPKRKNHGKLLGEESLTQALLLGMCDYMVCKQSGTSSGAIFFNKKLKDVMYV